MLEIRDLGRMEYEDAWNLQHSIFDVMVENKRKGNRNSNETVLLVEHSPVITLGRHARKDNVLFSSDMLVKQGVRIFEIERGGDVTYHGPGQLVAYPLMDLEIHKMGIKKYMNMLEEVVIRTLAHYEVRGERGEGASGVWIGAGTERERKICAVGVKCSRFCTMHGLALNINTDLTGFKMINPCGFVDKDVTSLANETGREMDFEEVKEIFKKEFSALFRTHTPFQEIS